MQFPEEVNFLPTGQPFSHCSSVPEALLRVVPRHEGCICAVSTILPGIQVELPELHSRCHKTVMFEPQMVHMVTALSPLYVVYFMNPPMVCFIVYDISYNIKPCMFYFRSYWFVKIKKMSVACCLFLTLAPLESQCHWRKRTFTRRHFVINFPGKPLKSHECSYFFLRMPSLGYIHFDLAVVPGKLALPRACSATSVVPMDVEEKHVEGVLVDQEAIHQNQG